MSSFVIPSAARVENQSPPPSPRRIRISAHIRSVRSMIRWCADAASPLTKICVSSWSESVPERSTSYTWKRSAIFSSIGASSIPEHARRNSR